MQRMRHIVREHNVYRWAANLLSDLTEIRVDSADRIEVTPAPYPVTPRPWVSAGSLGPARLAPETRGEETSHRCPFHL